MISLRNRVLGEVPRPTRDGLSALEAAARKLRHQLPKTDKMTNESFVQKYTGRRRTRYQNAADSLRKRPLNISNDSRVSAFVKSERMNPSAKTNPDPRMIQARNARFNISIGVYLRPIEHAILRLKDMFKLPLIGKGLNQKNRAKILQQKMSHFKKPLVISIDSSRFDQHVDYEVLKIENKTYLHCNSSEEFANMLEAQLVSKGRTQHGIKYRSYGKRMSGDMQTGVGNCHDMAMMGDAAMAICGVVRYSLFVDGDDTLIICDQSDEGKLEGLKDAFLSFGQEIKLENRATRLQDVLWCQCKPCFLNGEWQFVADWTKILSCSATGTKYWSDKTARYDMGFSVGQCYLALYAGTPIIQSFCNRLCAKGKINRDIMEADIMFKVRAERLTGSLGNIKTLPVTTANRIAFQDTFGVSVAEQLAIEKRLQDWSIGDGLKKVDQELWPNWTWFYQNPPALV